MAALPVLDLGDDPFERGLRHGTEMTEHVRANLETYLCRFEAAGVDRDTALQEGDAWADFIAGDNPEYAEEMRGVADGSKVPLGSIAMLNARYEITYSVFSDEARRASQPGSEPDGCTAFGLLPEATASGNTIIGQNWDWIAGMLGHTLILRVARSDKPNFVGFTEAGIVGCKMGVNEAGIGMVVNGLVTGDDGKNSRSKPFHVRCRELLDANNLGHAIAPLVASKPVCSANIIVGQGGQGDQGGDGEIVDIELTPNDIATIPPRDGLVVHANHIVGSPRVRSEFERIAPHTLYRGQRLERLLRRDLGRIEPTHIQAALSDHLAHPLSICRHEDETVPAAKRPITVTSIIANLTDKVLYATDGQPCSNAYFAFPLEREREVRDLEVAA